MHKDNTVGYVTIKEAARIRGVKPRSIRDRIYRRGIDTQYIDGKRYVEYEALDCPLCARKLVARHWKAPDMQESREAHEPRTPYKPPVIRLSDIKTDNDWINTPEVQAYLHRHDNRGVHSTPV
jgi:hypothetical protein